MRNGMQVGRVPTRCKAKACSSRVVQLCDRGCTVSQSLTGRSDHHCYLLNAGCTADVTECGVDRNERSHEPQLSYRAYFRGVTNEWRHKICISMQMPEMQQT